MTTYCSLLANGSARIEDRESFESSLMKLQTPFILFWMCFEDGLPWILATRNGGETRDRWSLDPRSIATARVDECCASCSRRQWLRGYLMSISIRSHPDSISQSRNHHSQTRWLREAFSSSVLYFSNHHRQVQALRYQFSTCFPSQFMSRCSSASVPSPLEQHCRRTAVPLQTQAVFQMDTPLASLQYATHKPPSLSIHAQN